VFGDITLKSIFDFIFFKFFRAEPDLTVKMRPREELHWCQVRDRRHQSFPHLTPMMKRDTVVQYHNIPKHAWEYHGIPILAPQAQEGCRRVGAGGGGACRMPCRAVGQAPQVRSAHIERGFIETRELPQNHISVLNTKSIMYLFRLPSNRTILLSECFYLLFFTSVAP
jgi:hypothetical protein